MDTDVSHFIEMRKPEAQTPSVKYNAGQVVEATGSLGFPQHAAL